MGNVMETTRSMVVAFITLLVNVSVKVALFVTVAVGSMRMARLSERRPDGNGIDGVMGVIAVEVELAMHVGSIGSKANVVSSIEPTIPCRPTATTVAMTTAYAVAAAAKPRPPKGAFVATGVGEQAATGAVGATSAAGA